ncbi:MAG: glycosyltransferase family 4 protein [Planctomycetota bacterium]
MILYIGAGTPWAGGVGHHIRQWMFLRALAELGRLELVLFDAGEPDRPCPIPGARVTRLGLPHAVPRTRLRRALHDLLSHTPRMIRYADPREAREAVARLRPERFDAVFAHRIHFAHRAGVLGHPRLLLDVDDPEHVRVARQAALAAAPPDWRTRRDFRKLRRFEEWAIRRARAAFVCQAADQQAFPPPRPLVVPNCVTVPPQRSARVDRPPRLLYLGNFSGGVESPNGDGLVWMLEAIWPRVQAVVPDAELVVAGAIDDELRRRCAARPGVRAAGFVDDLAAAFADAALSIAPLRFGTGTRIKILESLAHGCPVVSTPLGCEGLELAHGYELLVAGTPQSFTEACSGLLRDPARQEALSAAGCAAVRARYDVESRQSQFVALLRDLIGAPRPAARPARHAMPDNAGCGGPALQAAAEVGPGGTALQSAGRAPA